MNKSSMFTLITLLLITFAAISCNKANDDVSLREDELILKSINDYYKDAKDQLKNNEPEKAKEILDDINEGYINYPIKNDIDSLRLQIAEHIIKHEKVNLELEKAGEFISNQKYDNAIIIISSIDKSILNETQKDKILDYYENINTATAILDTGRISVDDDSSTD